MLIIHSILSQSADLSITATFKTVLKTTNAKKFWINNKIIQIWAHV